MAKSLFESAHEIKKNCRITIYPDGSVGEILACSVDIFVPDGWEAVNQDKSIGAGVVAITMKGPVDGHRSA